MPYTHHSHSGQFCHHATGQLEEVILSAIKKGFHTLGLTEHMPRFSEGDLYPEEIEAKCTPQSLQKTFEDYLVEARRLQQAYKSQINILVGCEIEFITIQYKQYIADLRQEHGIDYVVGSLHHVHGIPIDFSPELYATALEKHQGNLHDLFASYFDEQYQMLQAVHPEVVGHFDLIRIFRTEPNAGINDEVWDKITRNVELVISYGGLFEINSRAWKKGLKDAYPQRDVFKLIQDRGGKFTLSDDSHGPKDVGLYYNKLQAYLREMGVGSLYYLALDDQGKPVVKEHKDAAEDTFWMKILEQE
ncbi:hypothetical protein K450DRAFT_242660 [Umbelopsis ramanniana AG]|uniref:Histidinol-phosphatase n=1 Tax=Umbelopsis ramanniana AG TaxID=1314678 RepID=A0AAD5HCQ2_UMBRA|nr:uncharacterized protein K450DRAFT_242660 [Umbelopsis ramanniana AG]KAI8579317.1 hypothetical protein K450DRAFT_242660 [Umbelopsis ramanniana AG]